MPVQSHARFQGQIFAPQPFSYALPSLIPSLTRRGLRELPLPQYTVVKVGISSFPAHRLYGIMRGFREFGAQDTQFQHFSENDSPDDTVKNGKCEEKIVFICKCHDPGSAENEIRQLIGQQLGQSFQDQFTNSLDEDRRSYMEQVGKTEWILIKTDLMKWIQQGYRKGIIPKKLFGIEPTGQQLHEQMRTTRVDYHLSVKLKQPWWQSVLAQKTYNIEVKFSPTEFSSTILHTESSML